MTNSPADVYGLIGFPLEHSFSRKFFNEYFSVHHINAEYLNFEIDDIGALMEVLAEQPNLCGLNVTSPYKRLVMPYLDMVSDEAREIGAVNVIKISGMPDAPVLEGHNTDARGFATDIEPLLRKCGIPQGSKALVLGTGGASSAVYYGLRSLGIKPTLVSRRPADGVITYDTLTPEIMADYRVIVNSTTLGMEPHTGECPAIPYDLIDKRYVCYDLIYNPSPTEFLKRCAAAGATVSGGLGMLTAQARLSWLIWTGQQIK